MTFLATVNLLLQLAVAWLRLELLKYPDRKNDEIENLEDEIEKLRSSTDPRDHERATKLRLRIYRKRGVLASALSIANSCVGAGNANSDKDGNLHPASGGSVAQPTDGKKAGE